jgi:hypothetical protein
LNGVNTPAGAKEWQAMDINTVPTVSLRKMFNLAARAHAAGIAENLRRAFARFKSG